MASLHTTTIPTGTFIRNTIPLFTLPVSPAILTFITLETIPTLLHRHLDTLSLFAQVTLTLVVARTFTTLRLTRTREAFQNRLVVPRDDTLALVTTVGLAVSVGTTFTTFVLFATLRRRLGSGSGLSRGRTQGEEDNEEEEEGE